MQWGYTNRGTIDYMGKMKQINIRLSQTQLSHLAKAVQKKHISRSDIIREAIAEWMEREGITRPAK